MVERVQSPGQAEPFGSYLLDGLLARGGMARVYRARLRGLGGFEKPLVVKQILPELAVDPRFVELFVREANTLVQLGHPHIVPVYELGVVDGTYFLAMEYVEGASIGELLAQGALDAAQVAHVGAEVADALSYAHERFGLVHRDVSPRNVLVDTTGHVRLLDFGIAATVEGGVAIGIGSPGYAAPEQLRGEPPTPACDLFALGALLHLLLTGRHAFHDRDPAITRRRVLDEEGPTEADLSAHPPALASLVVACLARDAARRPTSARDVAERLRTYLAAVRPGGVANDLATRVATCRANAKDARDEAVRSPTSGGRERTPPAGVKTLATSPVLDEARRKSGMHPMPSTERLEPTTEPLPATPVREADVTPVTQPRPELELRATEPEPTPESPWPTRLVLATVVAIAALGIAILFAKGRPDAEAAIDAGARLDAGAPTAAASAPVRVEPEHADASLPPASPEDAGAEPRDTRATARTRAPETNEAPTGGSTLTVNATPWAEIRLDGRPLGTTPRRGLALPAGSHSLVLSCPPLGREARTTVVATPGAETRVLADLGQDPPRIVVRTAPPR
ncbi:MAG: protein kinase [Polyangiales bacterium]